MAMWTQEGLSRMSTNYPQNVPLKCKLRGSRTVIMSSVRGARVVCCSGVYQQEVKGELVLLNLRPEEAARLLVCA